MLYGHTLTRVGASLFAIGGWDGTRPLNEVRILEFPPPDEHMEEGVVMGGGSGGMEGVTQ